MLENMSDEERQKYEEQELMSDPEVQLSMMINERRKKGMVVHDHEMWVDVESDKKDAMSESAFKAFKNRIKKLKVKDFVKSPRILRARLDMTLYNPFCLPDACAHTPHVDMDGEHHTAVYYVNDSDGDTIIGDEKVSPKANRVVIFDGKTLHNGHSP